jgi:hypothetical protein
MNTIHHHLIHIYPHCKLLKTLIPILKCSIIPNKRLSVRFEAFTEVTMKNVVFWDVALCRSCVDRRFGGTYLLHLQGSTHSLHPPANASASLANFVTLKMEAIRSSETSVNTRPTQCHIPEDDILQKTLSSIYMNNVTTLRDTKIIFKKLNECNQL